MGVMLLESLLALGLFGDATDPDDGVCAGGCLVILRFTFDFPLHVGALAASAGNSSPPSPHDTAFSMLTNLTVTRFERRAGGDSHPSPDVEWLSGKQSRPSSLNRSHGRCNPKNSRIRDGVPGERSASRSRESDWRHA